MVTGNESQAGISPHGIEGVLTCHENPPRGFLSLGFMSLAAKLGLRVAAYMILYFLVAHRESRTFIMTQRELSLDNSCEMVVVKIINHSCE